MILVPKSTLGNWVNEIRRFCPSLHTLRFHGTKEERINLKPMVRESNRSWDVLITTYEMCVIEKGLFQSMEWNYLVIDEAHRLKNENSKLSLVLRRFSVKNRLLLTGTPLQVRIGDLLVSRIICTNCGLC